jgi:hypothetical protein
MGNRAKNAQGRKLGIKTPAYASQRKNAKAKREKSVDAALSPQSQPSALKPIAQIVAFSPSVVHPICLPARFALTKLRVANARYKSKAQYLVETRCCAEAHPDFVIAAYQASNLLEEDDAVFLRRERYEPLPVNFDALPLEDRQRLSREHHDNQSRNRLWYRIDENSTQWDHLELWGKFVYSIGLGDSGFSLEQATHSGAVEQWRALAHSAMTYQYRWRAAFESDLWKSPDMAGFVRGENPDSQHIVLGKTNDLPCYAALPRELVDRWLTQQRHDSPTLKWKTGYMKLDATGEIVRESDGNIVYREQWERTHQSTHAGSAALAWAFAQRRLRRMFDKLGPALRLQMPSTVKCLTSLRPIIGWQDADFDLVRRVEIELIAVAGELVGEAKEKVANPPSQTIVLSRANGDESSSVIALTPGHIGMLRELAKNPHRRKLVSDLIGQGKPTRERETGGKWLKTCEGFHLVDRKLGVKKGYAITPEGLRWLKAHDASPQR